MLHVEAQEIAVIRRELSASLREYNAAHGFPRIDSQDKRIADLRKKGRMVNDELAGVAAPSHSRTASLISAEKAVYSSPAKTLRAAEAAMAELARLSGEALRKQQERVNELVIEANRQNKAFKKKNPGAGS